MWAWWLNSAWMLQCAGERALFAHACRRAGQTQHEILRQTLHAHRDTCFGRLHGFAEIDGARAFQERVPATTYADYAPYVERIAAGEPRVLTREPVELLEPTSGTTGGEKLIPCTAGLRRQFQRGVAAWIADLFFHRPSLRSGRAYWSVSPSLGPPRRTRAGLPIGFADDAAYLGRFSQFLLRKLLVVPPKRRTAREGIADFRQATLRCLLEAEDLALISVWSPTFLTALLATLPESIDGMWQGAHKPAPHGARLAGLRAIWQSTASLPEKPRRTWPRLALISCWTDGAAEVFLPELRRLFPDVEIQPKGLLATEGFVSFPLVNQPGAALALRCHFFEFEELGGGRCRLAHQLEKAGRYRVIVTTAGGLYRYQLRDEIEVVGFLHQCPLLRFRGKCDLISDLVGEKLSEEHVRSLLQRLPALVRLAARFALLVPVLDRPPRYRLYLQTLPATGADRSVLADVRAQLEQGLAENPYYRHAVASGQLAPVETVMLDAGGESAWLIYERRCLELGQKCGDVKPATLDRWTGWPERFDPIAHSHAAK